MKKDLVNAMKYKFLNLMQYTVYLFSVVSMIEPVHSYSKQEPVLFQFDTVLIAFGYKVGQIEEIVLLNSSSHLF